MPYTPAEAEGLPPAATAKAKKAARGMARLSELHEPTNMDAVSFGLQNFWRERLTGEVRSMYTWELDWLGIGLGEASIKSNKLVILIAVPGVWPGGLLMIAMGAAVGWCRPCGWSASLLGEPPPSAMQHT